MRYQNERDEARRLQRSGSSRGARKEADLQDLLSFEFCRSSAVDHIEEISPESPRKMQDEQEVTSEASWTATGEEAEDGRRLEPEGETETLEVIVLGNEAEGVSVNPHHEQTRAKITRREREDQVKMERKADRYAPGEEGEEIQSQKKKVIQSERTQDYVRESLDLKRGS